MKSQGTALYPFVPSGSHFKVSIDFFAELGFEKLWQHDGLAGLRFGGAYFMLQEIDIPEWQKNQMIVFEVDDLDAYWTARVCPNDSRAFARGRRPISPGAGRFTSSTRAASAGT